MGRPDLFSGRERTAYIYFNNDWNAHAIANARELRALLGVAAPT